MITDCHFLLFDADENDDGKCQLIFWADLQSLVKLSRKKQESNKITFFWKNYYTEEHIEY